MSSLKDLPNPEQVILSIVKSTLAPLFAGLVLCAILAATTNVMAAQILVVASNLSEDFYKRIFRKHATSAELLWMSRISVVLIAILAFGIAFFKISTIYRLVLYSWSGLGASFGPLLLCLCTEKKSINSALSPAFSSAGRGGIWPYYNHESLGLPSLVVGFILGACAIEGVSFAFRKRVQASLEP